MNTFTFNNQSSADFSLIVAEKDIYSAPAYDQQFVSVPGRNGDVIIDNGRYNNVDVSYTCYCKDLSANIGNIKLWLCQPGYSKLAAVDTYCKFAGIDCHVKFYKIQKKLFHTENKNLRKEEYLRLIEAAKRTGKHRLALLIETIGATGIRVSEVQYITVEAVRDGVARIHLKGKIRTILIPGKLCSKLMKYAKKNKITAGEIFITGSGKGISRKQIWAEMKAICKKAGVEKSKVFTHNLRHLFARIYFRATHDIAKLADVLGHSAIETTRIYLLTTEQDHARQLEQLGLVS